MAISWVVGGVERGELREDDASYVTNFSGIARSEDEINNDPRVEMARLMSLPVSITSGERGLSVQIEFPDPTDDGIQHVNPTANGFYKAMGWNPTC